MKPHEVPVEGRVVAEDDAWNDQGQRLREVDPDRYRRLLALVRSLVALHDRELESEELFASRSMEISPRKLKILA